MLQNSYKTDEKRREKFYALLDSYSEKVEELGIEGMCIACGRRNIAQRKNKTHIPLSGAKSTARGFFAAATDGIDFCETCTFVVQFSPLTYYACGKYFDLLHSNSAKVMRRWAGDAIKYISKQIASGDLTGCFNEGYTNPQNALFHLAQDLIVRAGEDWREENPSLRLYNFNNFNQNSELEIYDLPAPVFNFLKEVKGHSRFRDWKRIVNRSFFFIKNGKQISLSTKDKPEVERKSSNKIYQDLLGGRSILHRFINTKLHKAYGDFSLGLNRTRMELKPESARRAG